MNKKLLSIIRLLVAAAGIGYIVFAVQWTDSDEVDGILTNLRNANVKLLIAGLLLLAPVYPIQSVRWWLLMRSRGMQVSLRRAFRLVMVGCFFNYCMPGTTGGDVIKAYYAAKGSDRRADAVMSVIFDRITGLLGLVLLAGTVGLFMLDHPVARGVTMYIWLGALAIVLISAVYFSKRLRSSSGLEKLLAKLPDGGLAATIDAAAVAYRDRKRAVLMAMFISVPVHVLTSSSIALAGYALGIDPVENTIGLMLTVIPVISLAGAVPLTYQGLGVMEGIGGVLIKTSTLNPIVGMLMMARLFQILYSLIGSLFLLRGDIELHPPMATDALDTEPVNPPSNADKIE
jgi:uncharacterized protein (TIRG00374 family)